MLKYLRVDLRKLVNYRPFWVLNILYVFLLVSIPISIMEFLKWLKSKGAEFEGFDPTMVPVLYFEDIWQNITYLYSIPIMKIFLAIVVIISVSNEFSYKTIRQNVIDGFSRKEFFLSKYSTVVLLAIGSSLVVWLTCMLTGMIYTPELELKYMLSGMQFVLAYFLDVLLFLTLAFFFTLFLKRSALTVFILLIYRPIELILIGQLPENAKFLGDYLPMQASSMMIDIPFPRYWLQEINDNIPFIPLLMTVLYLALFIWLINKRLQSSDL